MDVGLHGLDSADPTKEGRKEDRKQERIRLQLIQVNCSKELIQFDIELLSPDLAKSDFDFSIEGKDIRFGLNSIKGVSEKSLEALKSFIESTTPNKFDIFIAAKQASINIGLFSSLIQSVNHACDLKSPSGN